MSKHDLIWNKISLQGVIPAKTSNIKETNIKSALYLLLASVIFLAACAAPTPAPATEEPSQPAPSTLPALTDPSKPIVVNVGDTFMIVVEANPSTGYHWEMIGPLDDIHLELVSREYTPSEPVIPGSGGVEVWTLKAVASGEALFILGNYPPAEGASYEQEQRFTISIQ